MKKLLLLAVTIGVLLIFAGCGFGKTYDIRIVIPAGSQESFVYSDTEISLTKKQITILSGEGLSDTEVILKPVEVNEENAYEPVYITHGMPVKMKVEKGAWFQIGVSMQNPTEEEQVVFVKVSNIELRIE